MKYLNDEDMKDWGENEKNASIILRNNDGVRELYIHTKKGRIFSLDDLIDMMEKIIESSKD